MSRLADTIVVLAALLALVAGGPVGCGPRPEGEEEDYDPYERPDVGELECVPNLDGKVSADELQPALGVAAKYLVSPSGSRRSVDLEGEMNNGTRTWDWSRERDSDQSAEIVARGIEDAWYADSFPNGDFALPVDLAGSIDGIYRTTDSKMLLLGLASREESPDEGKTLLPYESPVDVYRFPIEEGQQWVSVGDVENGKLRGVTYSGKDTYRVEVGAVGEMRLPDFGFEQVHRVDTQVTVEAPGGTVQRRQVSFIAECFGEVARATSPDGVTKQNFDEAKEVRRLAAP